MKRTLIPILFVLSLAIPFSPAAAANLALVTSSDTFVVGDSIQVDLIVSGLTAGGPPSVGGFDIDVTFEPELTYKFYEFGSLLGDPNNPSETDVSTDRWGPYFNLYEESLLSAAALDAMQPASFTLATITFDAAMAGLTNIEGDLYALLDAVGNDLIDPHGPVKGAEIMISPVPIPSAILLLGSALAGLVVIKRKKYSNKPGNCRL